MPPSRTWASSAKNVASSTSFENNGKLWKALWFPANILPFVRVQHYPSRPSLLRVLNRVPAKRSPGTEAHPCWIPSSSPDGLLTMLLLPVRGA